MSDTIRCSLVIRGRFPTESFPAWIVDRARRLNLEGSVCMKSDQCIEVCLSGERVMVEAMEVACSLGPIDVQVDTVDVQQEQNSVTTDRHPRQFIRYCR